MDQAQIKSPVIPPALWRKSAGIICAPYILFQDILLNGNRDQRQSAKNILDLIRLYICSRQFLDDYIDSKYDADRGLLTPFSALIHDQTNSKFSKFYFLAYKHVHLMQTRNIILNLDSAARIGGGVLTLGGVSMLEELVFGNLA